jgi:hypothetical protein
MNTTEIAVGSPQAMASTDHEEIALRADKIYAARTALAEAERPAHRLGIAEIVRFLNDPGRSLSMEDQRALFADPKLRADYRRLKALSAIADLPALAAASAGEVNARRFEGGTLTMHPSRVPDQIYVLLRFNWPTSVPRMLLLESAQGELIKRSLPAADAGGEAMMVLDQKNASDAGFLRLLSDPTSTGSFLL